MIRVLALIGDAEGYDRVRHAVLGHAVLARARDARDFSRQLHAGLPTVIVVELDAALMIPVQDAIRAAVGATSSIRVIIACRFELAAMRALFQVREIGAVDMVIFDREDADAIREHLLGAGRDEEAIGRVRRMLAPRIAPWIRPILERGLTRRAHQRLTVNGLARSCCMRRETLTRLFENHNVRPPRHFVSWLTVLLAAANLEQSSCSVERVADELGMYSSAVLRRLLKRVAGVTPSQMRHPSLDSLVARFLLELATPRVRCVAVGPAASPPKPPRTHRL